MKLSKKEATILQFLYDWDEKENYLYRLENIHSIAVYAEIDDDEHHMKEYFGVDLTEHYSHKFFQFATDGAGGAYSFWQYKGMVGEAPIVFFHSDGVGRYHAANLEDFVSIFIHNIDFGAGWIHEDEPLENDLDELYEELTDDYNGEHECSKTKSEIIEIFQNQRTEFKSGISEIMTIQSEKNIESNLVKHPNFEEWFAEVKRKHVGL